MKLPEIFNCGFSQLNLSQQHALEAKNSSGILDCIRNSLASRTRAEIVSLYLAVVSPHLESHVLFWLLTTKKPSRSWSESREGQYSWGRVWNTIPVRSS